MTTTNGAPALMLDAEDLDPRRLQRLLWAVLLLAVAGSVLYTLTARRARQAELEAGAARDAANAATEAARAAGGFATDAAAAKLAAAEAARLAGTVRPDTTTTGGDHGSEGPAQPGA